MWFGTIIGALLGFSVGGWIGALLGALLGHFFNRGLARNLRGPGPEQRAKMEGVFFSTLFSVMGHLAKADGCVSEAEVSQTEQLMVQMGLTAEHRREAISLFQAGAAPGFSTDEALREFLRVCDPFPNLKHMLLVYLIGAALADGVLHPTGEQLLRQVAQTLGFQGAAFSHLLNMTRAQKAFAQSQRAGAEDFGRPPGTPGRRDELRLAYQALRVEENASDSIIKRAYRRLMSEYHPDKLIGQGMPEDMVKVATERSQEVQAAYHLIRKSRRHSAVA